MQYKTVDEYLVVSRITGPHHNLLQLRLGQGPQGQPECERLQAAGGETTQAIEETALVIAVLEGIADANARLGTKFSVERIRYVPNDSKPESAYRFMAAALLQNFAEVLVVERPAQ